MVYYKLILDEKRFKDDGIYTIVVRITFNKKNTTITTGVRISKDFWDNQSQLVTKFHPNFQLLNQNISESYLKIQKAIHKLQDSNEFSFEELKQQLRGVTKLKPSVPKFIEFTQSLITEMLQLKQTGNALIYQTAVNRFNKFCKRDMLFSEIDYNLLNGFKKHLQLQGIKQNSISLYFRTIKAIYNKAIKSKVVNRTLYPFYDISVKQERTAKRSINVEDIKNILDLDLEVNSASWSSRNYFLLSFYLIGMSFTDMAYLKPENISKGRLIYVRRKTHKRYSLKLSNQAMAILTHYKNINNIYLLPILFVEEEDSMAAKKLIHQWIKTTNKYLKRVGDKCELDSPLTTYVSRHSWATTAKKLGYSNEMIAQALGHEYGNKITNIYLDSFDKTLIDEMNEDVLNQTYKLI